MTERRKLRSPRGYAASRLDEVTLALLVALSIVAAGAVMQLGVNEALNRIERGLNGALNSFVARWRP